jgi:hypothetical protein
MSFLPLGGIKGGDNQRNYNHYNTILRIVTLLFCESIKLVTLLNPPSREEENPPFEGGMKNINFETTNDTFESPSSILPQREEVFYQSL